MAATTLRYENASQPWLGAGVAMLALAVGTGYALAIGELAGLYVAISLIGAVAVLFDFRLGAVLLVLMLPASASALFPHSLLQITGLNPLNVLLLATLGSYLVLGRLQRAEALGPQRAGALVPMPVVFLYAAPIAVAGVIGMGHSHEIPSFLYEVGAVNFRNDVQYLLVNVVKPMVMVAVALVIGAAAARSRKPENFIVPVAASVWLIALIQIGFVVAEAPSIATLALADERGFYAPLGIHANDLGRLHLFALALLLFVWAETKRPRMKLFLVLTLGLLAIALLLTFSRAAIAGAVVVAALFLVWKFNAKSLGLTMIGLVLVVMLGADALYARLMYGVGHGADAVSAGRIEGIWLPLLPELAKSPIWGNGLASVLWSSLVTSGAMVGHAHSAYLEALLDMGILGTALLLAYFAHIWKNFRALGKDASLDPDLRGFFQGATAALIAFFVTGIVGSSLRPDAEMAYLWIAIGLMYGVLGRRLAR